MSHRHSQGAQLFQHGSYEQHYGFRENPFSLTADPKFMYSSPSHERALLTILHALSRGEGLILVTGDIGCGKTTLCRRLLPMLPPRTFLCLVLNPFLAADDLLKQVLEDYGLVSAADVRSGSLDRKSWHELAQMLEKFLHTLEQMNGTAVIIVDEAQNLPLRTMEQIRLLSNFEAKTRKLLQIVLVGQRNLEPILELAQMRQLNQRVSRRCRIQPLTGSQVAEYVECRLGAAVPDGDTPRVRFTAGALSAVSRVTDGIPRIINLVCDRALEIGHSRDATAIDRGIVIAGARDLGLPIPSALRFAPVPWRRLTMAAAAAAILVAAIATWLFTGDVPRPAWADVLRTAPRAGALPPESTGSVAAAAPAAYAPPAASLPSPMPDRENESTPPPITVLETTPSYELIVASFETARRASSVADDLVGHGHPARVAASVGWNVVIVGPYSSLPEAEAARETLNKSGFSGIRIGKAQ